MDEYEEYLSFFDVNMSFKLNLPAKAKEVSPAYSDFKKQKNLKWTWVLDEDWYGQTERLITVKY
jgi:hypothetical protein